MLRIAPSKKTLARGKKQAEKDKSFSPWQVTCCTGNREGCFQLVMCAERFDDSGITLKCTLHQCGHAQARLHGLTDRQQADLEDLICRSNQFGNIHRTHVVCEHGGIEQVLAFTANIIDFPALPHIVDLGSLRVTVEHAASRPIPDKPRATYVPREEDIGRVYHNTHRGATAAEGTSVYTRLGIRRQCICHLSYQELFSGSASPTK